jgi:CTD small phosphatase-like protein 2
MSLETTKNKTDPIKTPLKQKSYGMYTFQEDPTERPYQLDDIERERFETPELSLPKITKVITPKELVFGPNVKESVLKKYALGVAQGIRYAIKQVKAPPLIQLRSKQIMLKSDPSKKTLLVDLDETLIKVIWGAPNSNDMLPPINGGDASNNFTVLIRPYAKEFLREMSKEFEVVIFTAAEKGYAEHMVNLLDPNREYISFILSRNHCLKTMKGLYIKDLRIIKNRDMKDMVIVDNFTPSFSFQIENGIPIITWDGDVKDEELKYLMNYLREAKEYNDMRTYNSEKLRLLSLASVSVQMFVEG